MIRIVRRVGIAIGSLVIAYLAVSLVGGILLGPAAIGSPLSGLVTVVLGGLIFADIIRRERPKPHAGRAPTA
jgi:uncharacterized membrane protein